MNLVVGEGLTADTELYRYVSLKSFISFVETGRIVFTNVNAWSDEWEVILSKLPTENEDGKLVYPLYSFHEDIFCQSWSLKQESDAMWRIYSEAETGLKIATSVGKFEMIEEIRECHVEQVVYFEDIDQLLQLSSAHSSPFRDALFKRDVFDHECEVRVLIHGQSLDHFETGRELTHVSFAVPVSEFIQGITLDPRADDWFVDAISMYCDRIGLAPKPVKSNLYEPDPHLRLELVKKYVPVNDEQGKNSLGSERGPTTEQATN